jgi:hypothetical protein
MALQAVFSTRLGIVKRNQEIRKEGGVWEDLLHHETTVLARSFYGLAVCSKSTSASGTIFDHVAPMTAQHTESGLRRLEKVRWDYDFRETPTPRVQRIC